MLDSRAYKTEETYEEISNFNLYDSISNDFDNIDRGDSTDTVNLDEIYDIVWLIEMKEYKGQNADSISSTSLAMRLLTEKENKFNNNKNREINVDLELLDSLI